MLSRKETKYQLGWNRFFKLKLFPYKKQLCKSKSEKKQKLYILQSIYKK